MGKGTLLTSSGGIFKAHCSDLVFCFVDPDVRLYVVELPVTLESKIPEFDLHGSCWGTPD